MLILFISVIDTWLSLQRLDLTNVREKASQSLKAQCAFYVDESTLWVLRELAVKKHYRTVSQLLRAITMDYLDQELNKEEEEQKVP
jgi:hypothetical protein